MTFEDKRDIIHPFVRTLLLDHDLCSKFTAQASPALTGEILRVVLRDFPKGESLIIASEILECFARYPLIANPLAVKIYEQLSQMDWFRLVDIGSLSIVHGIVQDWHEIISYTILTASYISGLESLFATTPSVYSTAVDDLRKLPNLCIVCTILLMGDRKRQATLWKINSHLQSSELWNTCLQRLQPFVNSSLGSTMHQQFNEAFSQWPLFRPLELEGAIEHVRYEELPSLMSRLLGPARTGAKAQNLPNKVRVRY